jgi:sugar lactone lactonase YvrE
MKLPAGYDVSAVYIPTLLQPSDMVFGLSGGLLVVGGGIPWVTRVTLDGEVSVFTELPWGSNAIAYNPAGELFIQVGPGIFKLSPNGELTHFTDVPTYAMTFGPDGSLYTIRAGPDNGVITVISSEGEVSSTITTNLSWICSIEFSPSGELFASDTGTGKVFKVNADGTSETIVSGLARCGDPISIAFDKQGNLLVASGRTDETDSPAGGIYKVSLEDSSLTLIMPSGGAFTPAYSGMVIDDSGNIFFGDGSTGNLGRVSPEGEREILVENWYRSMALAAGPSGGLFIVDDAQLPPAPARVLRLDKEGNVTTFADDLPHNITTLTFDSSGNLWAAGDCLLKITPQGEVEVIIDTLPPSYQKSIAFDPASGDLYMSGAENGEIWRITQEGKLFRLPVDFGKKMAYCHLAIDKEGNLLADVNWWGHRNVPPASSSLFKITPSGEMTLLHEYQVDQSDDCHSIAIDPSSADIFVLWRNSKKEHGQFDLNKVTPEGDIIPFCPNIPWDALSLAISPEGEIYFGTSFGIYRLFPAEEEITIDGLRQDWQGFPPLVTDAQGDMKDLETDIKAVYGFTDEKYLYLMVDFYEIRQLKDLNVGIDIHGDNQPDYLCIFHPGENLVLLNDWRQGQRPSFFTAHRWALCQSSEVVEVRLPLSYIGNKHDFNLQVATIGVLAGKWFPVDGTDWVHVLQRLMVTEK